MCSVETLHRLNFTGDDNYSFTRHQPSSPLCWEALGAWRRRAAFNIPPTIADRQEQGHGGQAWAVGSWIQLVGQWGEWHEFTQINYLIIAFKWPGVGQDFRTPSDLSSWQCAGEVGRQWAGRVEKAGKETLLGRQEDGMFDTALP